MKTRSGKLVVVGLVLIAVSVAGNAILYAFGASPFNAVSYEDRRSLPANGVTRVTIHSAVGDVRVVPGEDAIVAKVAGTAGRLERNGVRLTADISAEGDTVSGSLSVARAPMGRRPLRDARRRGGWRTRHG